MSLFRENQKVISDMGYIDKDKSILNKDELKEVESLEKELEQIYRKVFDESSSWEQYKSKSKNVGREIAEKVFKIYDNAEKRQAP